MKINDGDKIEIEVLKRMKWIY